jgi:hypothetical protein
VRREQTAEVHGKVTAGLLALGQRPPHHGKLPRQTSHQAVNFCVLIRSYSSPSRLVLQLCITTQRDPDCRRQPAKDGVDLPQTLPPSGVLFTGYRLLLLCHPTASKQTQAKSSDLPLPGYMYSPKWSLRRASPMLLRIIAILATQHLLSVATYSLARKLSVKKHDHAPFKQGFLPPPHPVTSPGEPQSQQNGCLTRTSP